MYIPKALLVLAVFDRAHQPESKRDSFNSVVDTVSDVVIAIVKSFVEDLVQLYEV